MRHLSAVPLLSTTMIAVLMLSMSILIACALVTPEPTSPAPPEPKSQPETPAGAADTPAAEIPADSPREAEAPPDLAGETPGSARMEESLPPTGARTKPVEPAKLAPPTLPREEMKSDAYSATAEDSVRDLAPGPALGPAPTARPHPRESTTARARPWGPNRTSRPAR